MLIKLAILAAIVLCISSSISSIIYYVKQKGARGVFYAVSGGKKGPLKSRNNLRCLTVTNEEIDDSGNYVGSTEICDNRDEQYVEYGADEELRIGDYCLNILGQSPNLNSVGFSLCDKSLTQKWSVKDNGTIESALDNKCLNNDILGTTQCAPDNNNMNQRWIF